MQIEEIIETLSLKRGSLSPFDRQLIYLLKLSVLSELGQWTL